MKYQTTTLAAAAALLLAMAPHASHAQSMDLGDQVMYGINRETSEMWRYDFANAEKKSLGIITNEHGDALVGGIDGSAYANGSDTQRAYNAIFAFRWDEDNYSPQMLWVDPTTAKAQIGNAELEGGPIGGATAVKADGRWNFYAVQHEKVSPPFHVNGDVRLNPNNSQNMQFELIAQHGEIINRNDLLNATAADLDADGTYFHGPTTQFRIRPIGQGNQNSLTITHQGEQPQTLELRNSNTYVFTGDMTVRVYNTKMLEGGNSMGHWFLEVDGNAYLGEGDVEVLSPHRLVHVAHQADPDTNSQIGTLTELAQLDRAYDSLASQDGKIFYAGHKNELWKIDITDETNPVEQLINSKVANPVHAYLTGMSFVGDQLIAYEIHDGSVYLLNVLTGQRLDHLSGATFSTLGTIVFCPVDRDRYDAPVSFD